MSTRPHTPGQDRAHATAVDHWAELGQLSAFLAHEINNALTPAVSYLDVAEHRPPGDPLRDKALDRAALAIRRIARLSDSVLALAAPQEHNAACAPRRSADLHHALGAALLALPQHPETPALDIQHDLEPAQAALEPLWIEHVLINLLVNADRAQAGLPSRHACITGRRRGPRYQLRVEDRGPGVPPELRQTLFDTGVTAPTPAPGTATAPIPAPTNGAANQPPPEPRSAPGRGLGLALCKRLLEHAGGSIALDPHHTPGAAFVLDLPLATPQTRAA
ncbi:MAG: HAMP domain-containing sensor histidine kinase [Planctomycetota bacterium]